MKSQLESELAFQLRAVKIDAEREYRFHSTRRWRFDFAIPQEKIAVEVEGLVYKGKGKGTTLAGRHVSVKGYHDDKEKYNNAAILGWRIIYATSKTIKSGEAIAWIEQALEHGR